MQYLCLRQKLLQLNHQLGLILKSVAENQLNSEVESMANRLATIPINQLAIQKW